MVLIPLLGTQGGTAEREPLPLVSSVQYDDDTSIMSPDTRKSICSSIPPLREVARISLLYVYVVHSSAMPGWTQQHEKIPGLPLCILEYSVMIRATCDCFEPYNFQNDSSCVSLLWHPLYYLFGVCRIDLRDSRLS